MPCLGVVSSDAIKWAVYGSIRACRGLYLVLVCWLCRGLVNASVGVCWACVLVLVSLLWVEWTRLVIVDLWT